MMGSASRCEAPVYARQFVVSNREMARPPILDPLFRSLRSIKGIGPQLGALLTRFFGAAEGEEAKALDVLMHMPSGVIDRRRMEGVARAFHNNVATVKVHIDRHMPAPP